MLHVRESDSFTVNFDTLNPANPWFNDDDSNNYRYNNIGSGDDDNNC